MIGKIFEIYGKKVKVVKDGPTLAEQCEACVFNKSCDNPTPFFDEPCAEYGIGRNRHFELVEEQL